MKGILVNNEYCTGCHACEVACRVELGLQPGEFGIKLTEFGPYEYKEDLGLENNWEWTYTPVLTRACNLCAERTAVGKMPSCVQHCNAWCMYYGEIDDLAKKMDGVTRWTLMSAIR